MTTDTLFEQDHAAWVSEQVRLLRNGLLAELDKEHLAEELEEIMGNYRRELYRRLRVLITHLLKWQYQPDHRSSNWKGTIRTQRDDIDRLFKHSPSLRRFLDDEAHDAYREAKELAADETGLFDETFPTDCPYTTDEILSKNFWPE